MIRKKVLELVVKERDRQDALRRSGKIPWTANNVDISDVKKLAVLAEEFGEVSRAVCEAMAVRDLVKEAPSTRPRQEDTDLLPHMKLDQLEEDLRNELVQVAAVCVAWLEGMS